VDLRFQGPGPGQSDDARDAAPVPPAPTPSGKRLDVETRPSRALRVAVVAVVLLGVVVRFAARSHLWLDEALTVNIARLPLRQIPAALRQDGAPPTYYVLLHAWMAITGTLAVRALPGLFGVATIPLTFTAARRVAGRRVAWAATLLLCAGPFAARYATEGRMYTLVMVEVLVAFLAVLDLLEGGGRRPAAVLAVATGLGLLTHYWTVYLAAVAVVALVLVARRGSETARSGARTALVAMAIGALAFLPWLPSFLYQLRHTGTPWGDPGSLRSVFDTVTDFAGGYWDPGIALGLMYFGLVGLAVLGVALDSRHVLLDLRPRSPGGWLAAVTFGSLAVAILAGIVGRSAFAVRYAAVLYPLFVIVVGVGTDVFADRRVFNGVLAAAIVLGLWADVPNVVGERTSAPRVAAALDAFGHPGDVVAYCPDQLGPSVSREIRSDGLVQLTFPRAIGPERVDWVDYMQVNHAGNPAAFAQMLLARAGSAHDVWVVWAPGYKTYKTECQNLIQQLGHARPDNQRVVKVSTKYFERPGLVQFRAS
jgi:hypothetical protein